MHFLFEVSFVGIEPGALDGGCIAHIIHGMACIFTEDH